MKHILSRENLHFRGLKKLCLSGRERRKKACIVLEGMHLIQSYTQFGGEVDEIIVSEAGQFKNEIADYLKNTKVRASITVLADALFTELTQVDTPSGILAIASQPQSTFALQQHNDTVLLDGIQDPGNVGSILRSAAAAGFRQVLLSEDCAQAWSPKVLRSAMGAHFQLDLHENVNLKAFLDGYCGQAVLTSLDSSASLLYALNLGQSVAWVFGNEGQGVRPETAACVSCHVRIPMPGASESLNVAAAAAICLFETVRQRLTVNC